MKQKKYALISVYDKTGIIDFANSLIKHGYQIISTGGTGKLFSQNNLSYIPIQEVTGNPEAFDGRMKTISFQIESGILFDRSNPAHVAQAKKLKIIPIDLVVCNLYPFEITPSIENIDVGGPTMIRAAAKNFHNVLVVVTPDSYRQIIKRLPKNNFSDPFRRKLAATAFSHLTVYDSLIAKYLGKNQFQDELTIPLRKVRDLRYGENPHQSASLYQTVPGKKSFPSSLKKIAGRDLSLINVTDISAGIESVRYFDSPCAVVIKHNNPCGIALGKDLQEALDHAIAGDPESAFGGIIVTNKPVDVATAQVVANFKKEKQSNIDIFSAPSFSKDAVALLMQTRKTLGIYSFGKIPRPKTNDINIKFVVGGVIIQTSDFEKNYTRDWVVVTKKKPTDKQLMQMKIGWQMVSRVKSNSILIIDPDLPMTRGIGSGQTSRIRSTRIALEQAGKLAKNAIMVSDSFFPFPDSVQMAAKYGIGAVIQQGGSLNDKLSIQAADEAGLVMVMTHKRAFWH